MYQKHHSPAAPALVSFLFSSLYFGGATPAAASWAARTRMIAISPDSHWVYAADVLAPGVAVIDATTNQRVKVIPFSKLGEPVALAVSPDGARLYGSDEKSNQLTTIDLATGETVARLDLGRSPGPLGLSPDGGRAYVLGHDGTVSVVDLKADRVIATIPVSGGLGDLVVQPDGSRVYVSIVRFSSASTAKPDTGQVAVIDTATNAVIQMIPVYHQPLALAVTPDGQELFVTHADPAVIGAEVVSTKTLKVVRAVAGQWVAAAAVGPDGRRLYVLARGLNLVAAIDLAHSQLAAVSQPVAGEPDGLAISPDGRRLYLEAEYDRTLFAIDAGTLQPLAAISLLTRPIE